jgi:hypothetical protein
MKAPIRVLAAVLAAALATSTLATPASAFGGYGHHFFFKKKMFFKHHKKVASASSSSGGGSNIGPYVVGCIGTTALALIVAALIKKNGELTTQQAQRIAFSFCGSGFFQVAQNLR